MSAVTAFIPDKCIGCGACKDGGECFAGARESTCRELTPDQLWKLIAVDLPYFKNADGGVTFSGGECMLQHAFLAEVVKICRDNNVHTAVDTAGHVPFDWLEKVAPDLFLYDIKAATPECHKALTGVDGLLVWENLERLVAAGHNVHVRVPCIPGANWDELPQIASRLKSIGISDVELLAYHNLGQGKAAWYGQELVTFEAPSPKDMEQARLLFA